MEIKILIGLLALVAVAILINGCIETATAPVCGNGILEAGETSENCCIDVGCPDEQNCENNVCIGIEKYENKTLLKNDTGVEMADPAGRLCKNLGYKIKVVTQDDGGQYGVCIFPDESECDEWAFYAGLCGQNWSYCEQHGYTIEPRSEGKDHYSGVYGVCMDENNTEVGLVSDLMNLTQDLGVSLPQRQIK